MLPAGGWDNFGKMKKIFSLLSMIAGMSIVSQAQKIPAYSAERLMKRASNPDTTYIVNFWASWCGPCVAELPEFTKLQGAYKGKKVKVLLVSLDFPESYPEKLAAYVAKKGIQPEVVWFAESNANEFIPKIDNRWSGALPATLIINRKAKVQEFLERKVTAEEVQEIVNAKIGRALFDY